MTPRSDQPPPPVEPERVSTGIPGLDDILGGGLDAARIYLIEGRPGTGKTTLALRYLLEGARRGEAGLYITMSESEQELRAGASRHGWSLDPLSIFELVPTEATLDGAQAQSLFHPSEMELGETTKLITDRVTADAPTRVVFDSLSELRLLAQSPLRYRQQILALRHFFAACRCTVLLLDDLTGTGDDLGLHSIVHGVLTLEQVAIDYGPDRRRLRVVKMRGNDFRGGYHDFVIRAGGIVAFPRLVASEHRLEGAGGTISSGNAALDDLLGGGLDRGTSALLIGGAGVGKSSIALTFAVAAAERGEHAAVFAFDEGRATILARAGRLGIPLAAHIAAGRITLQQIDPAELSPGEFVHRVHASVERDGARIVVIDTLNGYLNAMPAERFLVLQMHEVLSYLAQLDVVTLLVLAQHGLMGPLETPLDVSYLSDAVLMLRYFESEGHVRRALSLVKKRSGAHEDMIREFRLTANGLEVGPPLTGFHGVLTGVPVYRGDAVPLLGRGEDGAE
ncbi:MAG: AAA family ATPase [Proteobacteria bacterium]|nr:AAA family ATPase [Pseudomonadota bacterium]